MTPALGLWAALGEGNVRDRIIRLTRFPHLLRVLGNRLAVWEILAGELTGRPAVMLGDPTCGRVAQQRNPSPTPGLDWPPSRPLVLVLPSHSLYQT